MADVWLYRWRISGVNFEGRRWHVSKPIEALAREVGPVWPDNHPLDGTSASSSHYTNSDHYPDPDGVVRAIDVGELIEGQGSTLFEELRASRDPRLRYAIHEREMFSSYVGPNGEPPWVRRPYRGSSEHLEHVHLSVWKSADTDGSPWGLRLEDDMPTADEIAQAVWAFGAAEHQPLIMQRIAIRTYVGVNLLLKNVGALEAELDPAALADAIADALPAASARELADELHRRLAQ